MSHWHPPIPFEFFPKNFSHSLASPPVPACSKECTTISLPKHTIVSQSSRSFIHVWLARLNYLSPHLMGYYHTLTSSPSDLILVLLQELCLRPHLESHESAKRQRRSCTASPPQKALHSTLHHLHSGVLAIGR